MYGAGLTPEALFAGRRFELQVGVWAFKVAKQISDVKSVNVFFMY